MNIKIITTAATVAVFFGLILSIPADAQTAR
jgi:hypothetical protein